MDLSLVSIDDLIKELKTRGVVFGKAKKPPIQITHADIVSELIYEQDTGIFFKRNSLDDNGNPRKIGYVDRKGYAQVYVCGRAYPAHRLAWLYVEKKWPNNEVDHINGDRLDNRFINLRDVTKKQNSENRKNFVGKSGVRGVCWSKQANKWKAYVRHNQKLHNVGFFDCKEEAGIAAKEARDRLFTHHAD